jgi:hypothetical protein
MTWARPTEAELRKTREAEKSRRMRALLKSTPVARHGTYEGRTSGTLVAKENASQSEAYMAAARALGYCMRCRLVFHEKGVLQFCHADQGKGTGIKTDVRRGWPGCPTCHHFVGTSGKLPKELRRAEEDKLGAMTREAVLAAGTWPKGLALWSGT